MNATAKPKLALVCCAFAMSALSCSKGTGEGTTSDSATASKDSSTSPGTASGASGPSDANRMQLPSGHSPVGGGQSAPTDQPHGAVVAWTTPASWKQEPPSSGMRYAQFRVSGVDGDPEDAECAVFYFGPGQGGSPQDNASRWVSQFTQPDGSSSQDKAKIEVKSVAGKQVMFVEVAGTYTPAMMGKPGGESKKDYALIGAIVSGPDAPWFFKLTGPQRTVDANRAAFNELIASVH